MDETIHLKGLSIGPKNLMDVSVMVVADYYYYWLGWLCVFWSQFLLRATVWGGGGGGGGGGGV